MIKEMQKRPFARPLLFWILGILLYVYIPFYSLLILSLLSLTAIALLLSFILAKKDIRPQYGTRWSWGIIYVCIILIVSVLTTEYSDSDITNESDWLKHFYENVSQVRSNSLDKLKTLGLSDQEQATLGGILLGGSTGIGKEIRTQFSVTGVTHILSVSGFHVAIVCGFVSLLLKPLPSYGASRWIKYILTMILLWSFTFVSGLAPPSVRSAIMLSLFLSGQVIRRTTDGYNTLAASAFCMLVYNPFYLFDIGFQLSYIAVLFILLLQPPLKNLLAIRNPLLSIPYDWITVSIAAQAGTAFLCLYYFSQFPVLFLFANLLFSLVSTFLIPLGLIYIVIPFEFFGMNYLAEIIVAMTRFLLYIVDSFSLFPWAALIIPFGFIELLLGYASLFFATHYIYKKSLSSSIISLSLFALLLLTIYLYS